jgi:hypothetical protein
VREVQAPAELRRRGAGEARAAGGRQQDNQGEQEDGAFPRGNSLRSTVAFWFLSRLGVAHARRRASVPDRSRHSSPTPRSPSGPPSQPLREAGPDRRPPFGGAKATFSCACGNNCRLLQYLRLVPPHDRPVLTHIRRSVQHFDQVAQPWDLHSIARWGAGQSGKPSMARYQWAGSNCQHQRTLAMDGEGAAGARAKSDDQWNCP